MRARLKEETRLKEEASEALRSLRSDFLGLEQQLAESKESCAHKDLNLRELQLRMSQTVQTWTQEQEGRLREMRAAKEENARTRREMAEAKKQVLVCEGELERALGLAADFRLKFEDEEKDRARLVEEVMSVKERSAAEVVEVRSEAEQLKEENRRLELELDELQSRSESSEKAAQELAEAKQEKEAMLSRERQRMDRMVEKHAELERSVAEEQAKLKETESELHAFYQEQMKSVLSEKVAQLQSFVSKLETDLAVERQESLDLLRRQHDEECASIRERLVN